MKFGGKSINLNDADYLNVAGTVAIGGSLIFLVIFVVFGFVQPGYNHLRDTVSMLAVGQWGKIQTVNFVVMAVTFFVTGLGLGWSIYRRLVNQISLIFCLFASGFLVAALFPTHRIQSPSDTALATLQMLPLAAQIHTLVAFVMIVIAPLLLLPIILSMRRSQVWKSYVPFTIFLLIVNSTLGCLWIVYATDQTFFLWKGLVQKIMIVSVLMWMGGVGWKLRHLSPKTLEKNDRFAKKQTLSVYPLSKSIEEKGRRAVKEYESGKTIEVIDIDEYFTNV